MLDGSLNFFEEPLALVLKKFRVKKPLFSVLWKKFSLKEAPVPVLWQTSKNQRFSCKNQQQIDSSLASSLTSNFFVGKPWLYTKIGYLKFWEPVGKWIHTRDWYPVSMSLILRIAQHWSVHLTTPWSVMGQKYNEKVFPVHVSFTLHGVLVRSGSPWHFVDWRPSDC